MSNRTIKAVSFDAAGTLIHLSEPVGSSYSKVAAKFGLEADPEALNRAFRHIWAHTPAPFSTTAEQNDPNEKSWWRRLVSKVFDEAGHPFDSEASFEPFFQALYDHFESPGTWLADQDALETLAIVSENLPTVILSNFDYRLRRILEDLSLLHYFDEVFLSCEQGASKPDPKLFRIVSQSIGHPPGEIIHVGDDPECDWKGAEQAGFAHFKTGKGQRPLSELLRELSLA